MFTNAPEVSMAFLLLALGGNLVPIYLLLVCFVCVCVQVGV